MPFICSENSQDIQDSIICMTFDFAKGHTNCYSFGIGIDSSNEKTSIVDTSSYIIFRNASEIPTDNMKKSISASGEIDFDGVWIYVDTDKSKIYEAISKEEFQEQKYDPAKDGIIVINDKIYKDINSKYNNKYTLIEGNTAIKLSSGYSLSEVVTESEILSNIIVKLGIRDTVVGPAYPGQELKVLPAGRIKVVINKGKRISFYSWDENIRAYKFIISSQFNVKEKSYIYLQLSESNMINNMAVAQI